VRLIKKWLDKVTFRNVTRITTPPILLGIFLPLTGVVWVSVLSFVILLAAVVLQRLKWRCPNCGAWLGRHWGIPSYCSKCGEELDKW
jgi:ribosomal protein S27AE